MRRLVLLLLALALLLAGCGGGSKHDQSPGTGATTGSTPVPGY